MQKIAVVLFNLGGPDNLSSVKPFLFNLFYDKAILNWPNPIRWVLAKVISHTRTKKAKSIYAQMGGKSPLLENTQAQANALKKQLGNNYEVFIAMRYWHPMTSDTIQKIKDFNPNKITLLPLYPQYSTTTTKSSIDEWDRLAKSLNIPTTIIESYPTQESFIKAHADLILPLWQKAKNYGNPVLLFSAHSLPQKVIDQGDPYQQQIEQTARAIVKSLNLADFEICYQSKVGPLKWLSPTTEECIKNAASKNQPIIIVPISFVSEHSETLVELDIDYKNMAYELGCPFYGRVPALGCHPNYIKALKELATSATNK